MSQSDPRVIIRPFRAQDQDAVRELILDGLGDHFPVVDETLNPDLEDIKASYIDKGHAFIVAQRGSDIVGAGGLLALDDQTSRIVRVSVSKGQRRQGIGGRLVARLVELARERKCDRLLVETNLDWLEAIALYRNYGFRPYDRDEVSVHMDLLLNNE